MKPFLHSVISTALRSATASASLQVEAVGAFGDAVAAASRRELPRSQARELLAEMLGCRPDELPADQRPN